MTKRQKTIGVVLAGIGVLLGVFFLLVNQERGELEKLPEKMVKVSGAVIDPMSRIPVAGVDLRVEDTSIRTTETGRFIFPIVSTEKGIRLTHPELLRAFVKLSETRDEEQTQDILFQVALFNTLVRVVDQEARTRMDIVYEVLASEVQKKLSKEAFQNSTARIFGEADITNQEIVIRRIQENADYYNTELDLRFARVLEFELLNNGNTKWYRFVLLDVDKPQWQLIL